MKIHIFDVKRFAVDQNGKSYQWVTWICNVLYIMLDILYRIAT
jgi:hypothetical protein